VPAIKNALETFDATITADYDAQSAVERELVLRLASLLWRLRRATTMETGLFEIQAEHLSSYRQTRQLLPNSREIIPAVFGRADMDNRSSDVAPGDLVHTCVGTIRSNNSTIEFARCFLRLANLPNFALDCLSRYEATLWRHGHGARSGHASRLGVASVVQAMYSSTSRQSVLLTHGQCLKAGRRQGRR
jgi:hypothetical protein